MVGEAATGGWQHEQSQHRLKGEKNLPILYVFILNLNKHVQLCSKYFPEIAGNSLILGLFPGLR